MEAVERAKAKTDKEKQRIQAEEFAKKEASKYENLPEEKKAELKAKVRRLGHIRFCHCEPPLNDKLTLHL